MTLVVVVFTTCLLLLVFQKMIWIVLPILLAQMLYYILRPAVDALVVRGVRRETAAKAVCLLQMLVAGVVILVLLFLAKSKSLQDGFGRYLAGGHHLVVQAAQSLEKLAPVFQNMHLSAQAEQRLQQYTDGFVEKNLFPIGLQLLEWLPSLLLVPYIAYFMLTESAHLKKYIIQSVPNAFFEKTLLLFSHLDASFQNYFQGLLVLTFLDATCLAFGLFLVGIPNAIWLGLAAAVLAWVPYLGSIVGCIVVVLVAATDLPGQPWKAYVCLLLFLAVRLLDDFVFMPITIGRKLRIHVLLSVLMLLLGGELAGVTGLVFALPLFGVVAVIAATIAQVVADPKLRTRYKHTRELIASRN